MNNRAILCAASMLAGGFPVLAVAQSAAPSGGRPEAIQSEVVIVTARARAENLQEIPLAITAIDEQAIVEKGISDFQDIVRNTAGLTFAQGFGPQDTRPQLRGLSTLTGRPSVAILLDGVDLSSGVAIQSLQSGGGTALQSGLVDLARVEIVKGPQSVYFGRNAFAGAIQYISQPPSRTLEASAQLEVGDNGLFAGQAMITGPLGERVQARLNLTSRTFDGFYQDFTDGKDLGGEEMTGGALAVAAQPTDTLDLTLRIQAQDGQYRLAPYAFVLGDIDLIQFSANPVVAAPTINRIFRGTVTSPGRASQSVDPAFVGTDQTLVRGSLTVNWRFAGHTLTAITGASGEETTIGFDQDYSNGRPPIPADFRAFRPYDASLVFDVDTEIRKTSQELRLVSPEDQRFRYVLGGYIANEISSAVSYARANPSLFGYRPVSRADGRATPTKLVGDTTALFGGAFFDVTDQLTAGLELRWQRDELRYLNRSDPEPLAFRGNALDFGAIVTAGAEFDSTNPRFTLDYTLNDDVLLYASVARGTKPGLLNVGVGVPVSLRPVNPEELTAYEIGWKSQWLDGDLVLNGAVFYNDYKDIQVNALVATVINGVPGLTPLIQNAAAATSQGLELDAAYRPSRDLEFTLSYAFTDAAYDNYIDSTVVQAVPGATPGTFTRGAPFSYAGKTLPNVPEHSLRLGGRIERPLAGAWRWNASADLSYESGKYFEQDNLFKSEASTIVDVRAGVKNGRYSIIAYADNLFEDDAIKTAGYSLAVTASQLGAGQFFRRGPLVILPPKRQVGLRLRAEF